jgi:hypothetical protein
MTSPVKDEPVEVHDHDPANPPIAHRVMVWCCSTGPRAAPECLPVHEIALAKRRAESNGERIELITDFHDGREWSDRERIVTRDPDMTVDRQGRTQFDGTISLLEEHERLTNRYKYRINDRDVDLVADLYGPPRQGHLISVMRRVAAAGRKLADQLKKDKRKLTTEDLSALVEMCDPNADLTSHIPFEPALAGTTK